MADQDTVKYYKSWIHEKARAVKFGKMGYAASCDTEIARLEAAYPELVGSHTCNCTLATDAELPTCY